MRRFLSFLRFQFEEALEVFAWGIGWFLSHEPTREQYLAVLDVAMAAFLFYMFYLAFVPGGQP